MSEKLCFSQLEVSEISHREILVHVNCKNIAVGTVWDTELYVNIT